MAGRGWRTWWRGCDVIANADGGSTTLDATLGNKIFYVYFEEYIVRKIHYEDHSLSIHFVGGRPSVPELDLRRSQKM